MSHGQRPTTQIGSDGFGTIVLSLPPSMSWKPAGVAAVASLMATEAAANGLCRGPWQIEKTKVVMTAQNGQLDRLAGELWDLVVDGNVV